MQKYIVLCICKKVSENGYKCDFLYFGGREEEAISGSIARLF